MKVLNIHKRTIRKPKQFVVALFKTLATREDKVWPNEKWPAMKFKTGIKEGAKGGHGPIRYSVLEYDPSNSIIFLFSKPSGFNGTHRLELKEVSPEETEVKHVIDMNTSFFASLQWMFAIRDLHDALLEDCLDKIENFAHNSTKLSEHSLWVKFLRKVLA